MTPRTYHQHSRAEAAAATKRRIRDAALEVYRERGVGAATVQAIAERADVARGTVVNHYGSARRLLEGVLEDIVADLHYPDEHVLDGATTEPERLRRYVDAMFRFFERSEAWWPSFAADMELPALKAREQEYIAIVARLYGATFGDLAGDRIVGAAARAYANYMPLNDLRAAGLGIDEAIEVVAGTLIDLVQRRREELSMAPS